MARSSLRAYIIAGRELYMNNRNVLESKGAVKILFLVAASFAAGIAFQAFLRNSSLRSDEMSLATAGSEGGERLVSERTPAAIVLEETSFTEEGDDLLAVVATEIAANMSPVEMVEYLAYDGDADRAYSLMNKYLSGDEWDRLFYSVYPILAEKDMGQAIVAFESVKDDQLKTFAMLELAEQWAEQDVRGAFKWIRTLEGTAGLDDAYQIVMRRYISESPKAAAEIVSALERGRMQAGFVPEVARALCGEDIEASLNWVQELAASGVDTQEAMNGIVEVLSEEEPEVALELALDPIAGSLDEEMVDAVMDSLARKFPEQAAEAIYSLPEACRELAAESLARRWLQADEEWAYRWLAGLPSGLIRDCAVREAVHFHREERPREALVWAASLDDPSERIGLMSSIVRKWEVADIRNGEQAILDANISDQEHDQLKGIFSELVDQVKPVDLLIPVH